MGKGDIMLTLNPLAVGVRRRDVLGQRRVVVEIMGPLVWDHCCRVGYLDGMSVVPTCYRCSIIPSLSSTLS